MNYIVKWVKLDDTLLYYPCTNVFYDYDKALDFQNEMQMELESQNEKLDEIFDGKIVSDIFLEYLI